MHLLERKNMKREITAMVRGVYISPDKDDLQSVEQLELNIQMDGVTGDRHFGATMKSNSRSPQYPRGTLIRNSRQVSLLSVEDLWETAQRLGIPEIKPEWLGANLVLSGIPAFSHLPPSTRLLFPAEAALGVEGQNFPCRGPAQIIQSHYPDVPGLDKAFIREALHLRGIVAWVERPGRICPGDTVRVLLPDLKTYPD
jgi:hypothetical protein